MMSFILSWRRVALACALLMAAAGVLALRAALPGADAQVPPTATFVGSGFSVTPSNGFATLGAGSGSNFGVLGIACTRAVPRGGNRIPGQVVTELRPDLTYLRIMRNDGLAITGTVQLNCVIEVEATPLGTQTAERLKEAANAG
jgi:hypothetical protein